MFKKGINKEYEKIETINNNNIFNLNLSSNSPYNEFLLNESKINHINTVLTEGSFKNLILSYKSSKLNNKENLLTSKKKKNFFENLSKIDLNINDKSNFCNSNNTNNKDKNNTINNLLSTNSKKKSIEINNEEILSEFVNYNLDFENPENTKKENRKEINTNFINKTPKKNTLILSEDLYEKTLTKEKEKIINLISNKKINIKTSKNLLKKDEIINFSSKEIENLKNSFILNEKINKIIIINIYKQLFQNDCINKFMKTLKLFRYEMPLNFENVIFLSSLNSFNLSQNNNSFNNNENKSYSQSHLRADHSSENNNSSLINSLLPNLTIDNIFEGSKIKINKNKNIMVFDNYKNETILEEESCLIINSLQNNNLNLKSSLNEISLDNKMSNFNIQSNLYNVQEHNEEEKKCNDSLKLENIINNIIIQNNEINLDLLINKNEELKNYFKLQNIYLNKYQKFILFYNILQISQKNNYYIYQKNLFDKIYIIN
jgi:hypothetical protein